MLSRAFFAVVFIATSTITTHVTAAAVEKSKTEPCTTLRWGGEGDNPYIALGVLVEMNNHLGYMQLDTGTPQTVMKVPDIKFYGLRQEGKVAIGNIRVSNGKPQALRFWVRTDLAIPDKEQPKDIPWIGSLGLDALRGKINVIDFQKRKFCSYAPSDSIRFDTQTIWQPIHLRDNRLFVNVSIGENNYNDFLYDSGSSEFPLLVNDEELWKKITGRIPAQATQRTSGWCWDKPCEFYGAPINEDLFIGNISLGRPDVFAEARADGHGIDNATGLFGNKPFMNGTLIIDLTTKMRFGYLPDTHLHGDG